VSSEPSSEPSGGAVLAETSDPTLPPTDAFAADGQSGPDGTLPLVLMILGAVGLGAVALKPGRAKR
jgi:hypothetical protein